jgi:hypothetical protein
VTTKEEIASLLDLNERLSAAVHEITSIQGIAVSDRNMLAGVFLTKATKTHRATMILCKEGYGEDASILVRTILDMLINLKYMLSFSDDIMIDRYFRYDDVIRLQMYESAIASNEKVKELFEERERKPKPNDETLTQVRKRAVEAKEAYGYKGGWANLNLSDMAGRVGLAHLYSRIFKLYSQSVHAAPRVFNDYATRQVDGGYFLDYNPSDKNIDHVLVGVFDTLSQILSLYCKVTGTKTPAGLDKLEEDFLAVIKQLNS